MKAGTKVPLKDVEQALRVQAFSSYAQIAQTLLYLAVAAAALWGAALLQRGWHVAHLLPAWTVWPLIYIGYGAAALCGITSLLRIFVHLFPRGFLPQSISGMSFGQRKLTGVHLQTGGKRYTASTSGSSSTISSAPSAALESGKRNVLFLRKRALPQHSHQHGSELSYSSSPQQSFFSRQSTASPFSQGGVNAVSSMGQPFSPGSPLNQSGHGTSANTASFYSTNSSFASYGSPAHSASNISLSSSGYRGGFSPNSSSMMSTSALLSPSGSNNVSNASFQSFTSSILSPVSSPYRAAVRTPDRPNERQQDDNVLPPQALYNQLSSSDIARQQAVFECKDWVDRHVLVPIWNDIEKINSVQQKLGRPRIGVEPIDAVMNNHTKDVASRIAALAPLIQSDTHQRYLVARIRDLALRKGYRHEMGADVHDLTGEVIHYHSTMPCDAEILFRCVCFYLDLDGVLYRRSTGFSGNINFSSLHVIKAPERVQDIEKRHHQTNVYLYYKEGSYKEKPQFKLVTRKEGKMIVWETFPSRQSLYECLLGFVWHVVKEEGGILDEYAESRICRGGFSIHAIVRPLLS